MFEFTITLMPALIALSLFAFVTIAVCDTVKDIIETKERNKRYAEQMKKDAEFVPFWLK